jgi:hypothetical protein
MVLLVVAPEGAPKILSALTCTNQQEAELAYCHVLRCTPEDRIGKTREATQGFGDRSLMCHIVFSIHIYDGYMLQAK